MTQKSDHFSQYVRCHMPSLSLSLGVLYVKVNLKTSAAWQYVSFIDFRMCQDNFIIPEDFTASSLLPLVFLVSLALLLVPL